MDEKRERERRKIEREIQGDEERERERKEAGRERREREKGGTDQERRERQKKTAIHTGPVSSFLNYFPQASVSVSVNVRQL